MEIKQRMSKRLGWLLGIVVLVSVGLLVACGSKYNSSSSGLVLVGSQGSGLIETFGLDVGNGHIAAISNPPADTSSKTCVLGGLPSSLVVDRAGAYAYALVDGSTCGKSGSAIFSLKVNSDGTTTVVGNPVSFTNGTAAIQGVPPP